MCGHVPFHGRDVPNFPNFSARDIIIIRYLLDYITLEVSLYI